MVLARGAPRPRGDCQAIRPGRPRRLRHVVPRGHRRPLHDRAAGRAARRGGPRLGVPLPRRARRARDPGRRASPSPARPRTPSARSRRPAPRARPSSASPTWWARPSRARRPACSTRTPDPRSAWPRTKTFTATIVACYLLALWLGRRRGMLMTPRTDASASRASWSCRASSRRRSSSSARWPTLARDLSRAHELPLPGARHPLPDRAGGRAQAQGDLLHPRRGLRRPAR